MTEISSTDVPEVSVIMSCYNLGKYIEHALTSVYASTLQGFEVIIVDDGSDDESTREKLAGINDPRVRVILSENKGVSCARNKALELARGEYILPLDPDDKIAPTYLEKACAMLDAERDIAIVAPWYRAFGYRRFLLRTKEVGDITKLMMNNYLPISSLVRRSALQEVGGYAEDMRGYEDWELWIRLLGRGYKMKVLPEVMFFYRTRRDSKVNTYSNRSRPRLVRKIIERNRKIYERNMDDLVVGLMARVEERSGLGWFLRRILPEWLKNILKVILPEKWWRQKT